MTDLPKYHSLPPLTPHKRTTVEIQESVDAKRNELAAMLNAYEPTPTIPQMEDQHEQAILRDKLAVWLTRATFWFSVVGMTLFIGSLIYRATVGVY